MSPASTTPDPVRAPRSDSVRNRRAVIEAARRLMATEGIEAGMDEIAKAAGVGVGTVYRHFPTKEDLVAALALDRFEGLADLAREALAEPEPGPAFERFLYRAAELQAADQSLSEVMRGHGTVMPDAAGKVGLLDLTRAVLGRAQEAGAIRSDLEAEDVPMLMCGVGSTNNHPAPFIGPQSWRRLLALAIDGMRIEASELPPRD